MSDHTMNEMNSIHGSNDGDSKNLFCWRIMLMYTFT